MPAHNREEQMNHFEVDVVTNGAEAEFVFAHHLCTVRFRKFATGEEASEFGKQMLKLLVGADQYIVTEINPDKMIKGVEIYRSAQPAREQASATVEEGTETETKTLPLAEGEEDNLRYVLRDGTRTGCAVLADLERGTESDIYN